LQVCPGPDGKLHKNALCPVNVSTQPEGTLPDIQSAEQAVKMVKEFQANASRQVCVNGVVVFKIKHMLILRLIFVYAISKICGKQAWFVFMFSGKITHYV